MKSVKTPAYSFNEAYMKRVKKDAFIKAHSHLENIDLASVWDKYNGKVKPESEEEK